MVARSVFRAGALRRRMMSVRPRITPNRAMAPMATARTIASARAALMVGYVADRYAYVARPVNAPSMTVSPCENTMTLSTPKKRVKPTATSAYIMPSMSPLIMNWAIRDVSIKIP